MVFNDPVAVRHIMVTRGYSYGKHEGVRVVFRWIEGSKYGMGSLEGAYSHPILHGVVLTDRPTRPQARTTNASER